MESKICGVGIGFEVNGQSWKFLIRLGIVKRCELRILGYQV